MINFEFPASRTISSFFQISFSQAEDLRNVDLPLGDNSHIMIAMKGGMVTDELNQLTDNFDERLSEREIYFEMFDSIDHHILYIFN